MIVINKKIQYVIVTLVVVMTIVLLTQTFHKAYRPQGYDFTSYLLSAEALLQNNNPYATDTIFPYIYPLFLAFALVPLSLMPYGVANFVWFALNAGALYLSVRWLIRMAPPEAKAHWGWPLAVPLLVVLVVMFAPLHSHFLNGQVNLIVLAACVLFFRAFSRDRPWESAAWLAVAIAIKIVPAILVGFLLLRKKFSTVFLTLVLVVILCLLPGLMVGESLLTYYHYYLDTFLLPRLASVGGGDGVTVSYNLQGMITYLFPSGGHPAGVKVLSSLTSLLLVLVVDLSTGKPPRGSRSIWAFCAYMMGAVLFSPMGETHHLVLILPAVVVVAVGLFNNLDRVKSSVKGLALAFATSFVLLPKIAGSKSMYFVPLVLLLILLYRTARGTVVRRKVQKLN